MFVYENVKDLNHWALGEAGTQLIDATGDHYIVVYAPDLPDDRQDYVLALDDGKLYPTKLLAYPIKSKVPEAKTKFFS